MHIPTVPLGFAYSVFDKESKAMMEVLVHNTS